MAIAPIIIQRRYRELGRIRLGEKATAQSGKQYPKRLTTFRLTSPSKSLVERAAETFGGQISEWTDAPTEGSQWQVTTEASELPVLVPPQDLEGSMYFELWKSGGVQRRCDGLTELISGQGCKCDEDNRTCQITAHLQLMLPQLPDVGVWRLTTHGFNAAAELPGTVALLEQIARSGQMPGAHLAIEARTSKKDGETHHYVVPVLRLPQSLLELGAATDSSGIPMLQNPEPRTVEAAQLPEPERLPSQPEGWDRPREPLGPPPPPLPNEVVEVSEVESPAPSEDAWGELISLLGPDPKKSDNMDTLEADLRRLFRLMEACRVPKWQPDSDGVDALHRALKVKHGADHVGDLKKAELFDFCVASWGAARDAVKAMEGPFE